MSGPPDFQQTIHPRTTGIHPAKKPMEGGFSLDKFLPNISPEDAEALGKMLDDMETAKANGRKAADDAMSALDLLSRVRFALGDNGKRMQDKLIVYCAGMREALERIAADAQCVEPDLGIDEPCYERFPGKPECWCPSCVAYKALNP